MAQDSGTLLTTVGRAGSLFLKAWPRLFAWYLLAQLTHLGVMWVAVRAGYHLKPAGIAILALVVMVSLLMYVVMFLILRGELPYHLRAVTEGKLAPDDRPDEPRFLDAAAWALLPFLAFYTAWNFLKADAIEFENKLLEYRTGKEIVTILTGGQVPPDTEGFHTLSTWAFIALGVGAYLLRLLVKKRGGDDAGGPVRRLFVTYLEALWIFVTIYQASSVPPPPREWVEQRQVFAWITDGYHWLLDTVLGLGAVRDVWDAVAGVVSAGISELWGAAVLPLMFITVVAVIYGRSMSRPEGSVTVWRYRFDAVGRRWQATPRIVRVAGNSVVSDWKDRWSPVANAFRLVVRSGLRPLLGYFLAFAAVTAGAEWVGIFVRDHVVGPHSVEVWMVLDEPLGLVVDGLRIMLQVCLLAAAYDRMVGGLAGYLRSRRGLTTSSSSGPAGITTVSDEEIAGTAEAGLPT